MATSCILYLYPLAQRCYSSPDLSAPTILLYDIYRFAFHLVVLIKANNGNKGKSPIQINTVFAIGDVAVILSLCVTVADKPDCSEQQADVRWTEKQAPVQRRRPRAQTSRTLAQACRRLEPTERRGSHPLFCVRSQFKPMTSEARDNLFKQGFTSSLCPLTCSTIVMTNSHLYLGGS